MGRYAEEAEHLELDLGEFGLEGLDGSVGALDRVPGDVAEEPEHLVRGRPLPSRSQAP